MLSHCFERRGRVVREDHLFLTRSLRAGRVKSSYLFQSETRRFQWRKSRFRQSPELRFSNFFSSVEDAVIVVVVVVVSEVTKVKATIHEWQSSHFLVSHPHKYLSRRLTDDSLRTGGDFLETPQQKQ